MKINDWIEANYLDAEIIKPDFLFSIKDIGTFLIIEPKVDLEKQSEVLFDENFEILVDETEEQFIELVDFIAFCFGGLWYYSKYSEIKLNHLKYLGKAKL